MIPEKYSRIFEIFEEISAIPHGSENCSNLARYCIDFAKKLRLKYYLDDASNVVIYKEGNRDQSNSDAVILQGHLDMVCQKESNLDIDFLKDPLKLVYDGDFITAKGTTLGADNGIALAMILSILERNDLSHPPIEAVFTSDEEIGMLGAARLDTSVLSAKRMINLDAEEDNSVTVSCAGGSEISAHLPVSLVDKFGSSVTIELKGLKGGHSGVEINSGRINSNILAGRLLNSIQKEAEFDIISIDGGDKGNAIANYTTIKLLSAEPVSLLNVIGKCVDTIYDEIEPFEPEFFSETCVDPIKRDYKVMDSNSKNKLIYTLCCVPNGVQGMSGQIKNLVETSLNLGILKTMQNGVSMLISLRSNKQSSLFALEDKIKTFFSITGAVVDTSGFYPPWEYKKDSLLRKRYIDAYKNIVGKKPKVAAIHAGLECAVFAAKITDIDCIAIGPNMYDVHTVNERLSISSTVQTYEVLTELLKNL